MIEIKKLDTVFDILDLSEEVIFMKIDTQGFEKKKYYVEQKKA